MLFLKSMPYVVFAEELVALSSSYYHSQGAIKEGLAGVERLGGGLALGVPQGHGGRPARQEARAGRFNRQEGRERARADAF